MNYFKNIIEGEAQKDYYKKLHDFVEKSKYFKWRLRRVERGTWKVLSCA